MDAGTVHLKSGASTYSRPALLPRYKTKGCGGTVVDEYNNPGYAIKLLRRAIRSTGVGREASRSATCKIYLQCVASRSKIENTIYKHMKVRLARTLRRVTLHLLFCFQEPFAVFLIVGTMG